MHRALEDSDRSFIGRGMKRTGVTVLTFGEPRRPTTTSLARRLVNWFTPVLHAQAVYEPGGAVYISAWDDGDPGTWEGNIYAVDYDTGGQYSTDAQIYVADPNYAHIVWDWGYLASPPYGDDTRIGWRRFRAEPRVVPVAANNASCDCGVRTSWGRCAFRRALDDSWPYCAAAAGWCLISPNYLLCAGGACYVNLFAKYLTNMKDTFGNCYNQ
jgi:hypothetical protein